MVSLSLVVVSIYCLGGGSWSMLRDVLETSKASIGLHLRLLQTLLFRRLLSATLSSRRLNKDSLLAFFERQLAELVKNYTHVTFEQRRHPITLKPAFWA